VLAILGLAPTLTHAQPVNVDQASDGDRAIARELTIAGLDALERGDYARAEQSFQRATTILWAPTIGLGLARARAGLGKLLGAQEAYNRVSSAAVTPDASPAFRQAVLDANRELAALRPRVPKVLITLRGAPTADVTLDGVRIAPVSLGLPRPTDPGRHVIRARAPGFAPTEVTITLPERSTQSVVLDLKPGVDDLPIEAPGSAPAPPGSQAVPHGAAPTLWATQRTLALVAGGAGVAGFALTAVFTAQAASKNNDSKPHCLPNNPDLCDPQGLSLRSDAQTAATIATATFIAGSALVTGGTVLWFTAPSSEATGSGRLEILPASLGADIGLGLRGRW
jgi:hypothetical protein